MPKAYEIICGSLRVLSVIADLSFNLKSFWLLDVNECMDPENECTQLCNNYIGGYRCFCRPGYILDSDKHTCQGNEWDFETRILAVMLN